MRPMSRERFVERMLRDAAARIAAEPDEEKEERLRLEREREGRRVVYEYRRELFGRIARRKLRCERHPHVRGDK